jgi:hypothetical protein
MHRGKWEDLDSANNNWNQRAVMTRARTLPHQQSNKSFISVCWVWRTDFLLCHQRRECVCAAFGSFLLEYVCVSFFPSLRAHTSTNLAHILGRAVSIKQQSRLQTLLKHTRILPTDRGTTPMRSLFCLKMRTARVIHLNQVLFPSIIGRKLRNNRMKKRKYKKVMLPANRSNLKLLH